MGRRLRKSREFIRSKKKRPYSKYEDKMLQPKTIGQRDYMQSIKDNKLTICTGPAGTGKTIIAAAMAVKYVKEGLYNDIVIVRPAVTACDEEIGFLPGDVDEKMGPFMLPVIHNIGKVLKQSEFNQFIEFKVKIMPLAFMRGITLDNCVVILDEAQNTQPSQMKMFLTRLGENCKAIVEGDEDQTDIEFKNGLEDCVDRLSNMEDVGIIRMDNSDIVRSTFVSQVLQRYK